jgi:DNA helicase-2/ATP-dependent DNA helicase PcrA
VVFIVGMEEGILPHSRSLDEPEELAEERRLFYVGLTRAKDRVYLTHTFRRTFYGETEIAVPSRFLHDIPGELLDGAPPGQRREETKQRASSWQWTPSAASWSGNAAGGSAYRPEKRLPEAYGPTPEREARPARAAALQFRTGQKVRHAKFGEGIVIESKATGTDEEVAVAFSGLGIKRLVASMAKLEKVEGGKGKE